MGAERKWLFTLFSGTLLSLLLLLLYSFSTVSSPKPFPSIIHHGSHYPPAFAYYIYGGSGDKDRIFRLLLAVYHPRNRYLLHLAADASDDERLHLAAAVRSVPAKRTFENVDVASPNQAETFPPRLQAVSAASPPRLQLRSRLRLSGNVSTALPRRFCVSPSRRRPGNENAISSAVSVLHSSELVYFLPP